MYDMNAIAAAWEQQQQQQLSPVIFNSQGGQQQQQHFPPHQMQHPFFYPYPPHPAASYPYPPPHFYPTQQPMPPQIQQFQQSSSPKPQRAMVGDGNGGSSNNNNRRTTPNQSESPKQIDSSIPSSIIANNNYITGRDETLNAHVVSSSGSLPPLQDIFSSEDPHAGVSYIAPLVDSTGGGGDGGGGYGSIPSLSNAVPKIYNAPVTAGGARRLPPSGRSQQQQPVLVRTNSSNDVKKVGMKTGVPANRKSVHRRSNSDTPLRGLGSHRRGGSGDLNMLPPSGAVGHNRSRTFSGGNPLVARPRHRRNDSASSMPSYAGSTADASMVSVRSNIARSSLFGGMDVFTGKPIMHFPFEAIRIITIPAKTNKKKQRPSSSKNEYCEVPSGDEDGEYSPLTVGHLYSDNPVNSNEYFEDYHKVSDFMEQGDTPQWESLDGNPLRKSWGGACGCQCVNCNSCTGKQELLFPSNYVMPVSDDIYKRVLEEISSAQNMPCGLFFCGHHEDVAHPSIWIAGTLVILLFATLMYLAFYTEIFMDP
jgi:hypothetical protein